MGPKRKAIPYATADERRDLPFTEDMELASLFALAEARSAGDPLQAISRVCYPLHIRPWEGGALLIDQLGLSHASIRYRVIPDVDDFKRALAASSDDPYALREVLNEKGAVFKGFSDQKRVRIDGLIVRPGKSGNLSELLGSGGDLEAGDKPEVFKPVLRRGDLGSVVRSIQSLRRDIKGDLRSLEGAKRSLMAALLRSRRALEGEIQAIRDEGIKAKAQLKEEYEEAKVRYRGPLDERLKEIREEYREKAAPLVRERRNVGRRLAKLRKKLGVPDTEESSSAEEAPLSEIEGLEARLGEVEGSIGTLRAWRDGEARQTLSRYRADLKLEADKIESEEARILREVQGREAEISKLEEAARGVASQIDRLIRSKKGKLNSLSRLRFDVEAEAMDLYVPFYVFRYGGKRFDFHPPVVASSSRGLISRFRRMLAENLQSKMAQLIRPRAGFVEELLGKAVRALRGGRDHASEYRLAEEGLNLLRSRAAVDKIMAGLVKIRREGWISDDEYIRLQEALVENLGLISRP
ncbi:hypothetical protein AC482_01295 [miscellaneous Crenarchaeota group-15 archaeon DG-45]|uniref:Uncharacterized protein n=1 Tax=miscellaneous Crenarchaeota group-15 archaeon DG-45 TaxID=1685127 RepID=A0A0M0BRR1_9ARCH|nr:MAG: hypothetical protein AC482_01295 [miscellaneous Crenarchaeota group-15 archaeon DG-45]